MSPLVLQLAKEAAALVAQREALTAAEQALEARAGDLSRREIDLEAAAARLAEVEAKVQADQVRPRITIHKSHARPSSALPVLLVSHLSPARVMLLPLLLYHQAVLFADREAFEAEATSVRAEAAKFDATRLDLESRREQLEAIRAELEALRAKAAAEQEAAQVITANQQLYNLSHFLPCGGGLRCRHASCGSDSCVRVNNFLIITCPAFLCNDFQALQAGAAAADAEAAAKTADLAKREAALADEEARVAAAAAAATAAQEAVDAAKKDLEQVSQSPAST